ncbi:MAG TPA: ABC transporter substrate-binding protein [Candidatus Limnocylindrales bacterium]|nr:ABC transporter substrate-binding protein [Candidatus Limnocylindrales bacterium]
MRKRKAAAAIASLALFVAACTGGGATGSPAPSVPGELGDTEGALNLVAWAGYVEEDWVAPFEADTGCQVNATLGNTSDEMVTLMKTGNYDGVSASGDASNRLIAGGDVAAVNLDLIPNYANVFEGLKNKPHNTVNGVAYGVPHGRGANLLMWRTDIVDPAPDSWSVVFDPDSMYKGKVTAYDAPIYIADAAVYLMATKPELNITNPYELDDAQFTAAVDLLKQQRTIIGKYWSLYTDEIAAFTSGDSVVGTTWQVIKNVLDGESVPVEVTLPKEGATGWSDTWMISSKAKNPNCMYAWMNYIISPAANAAATVYFGEAPVSQAGCDEAEKLSPGHCETFHATDEDYFSKVYFWATPQKECGDSRGAVCKDFAEWNAAWTEIKG